MHNPSQQAAHPSAGATACPVARLLLPDTPLRSIGQWLFVRRGVLPYFVLPLLVIPTALAVRLGWPWLALAALILAAGEGIRLWSVGYAGKRTRTRSRTGRLKTLVTAGPFARVRNPIYIGNTLIAVGIVLLFEQPFLVLPLVVVAFLFYSLLVLWEEQMLTAAFGNEYAAYCRAVRRWLPALRRYAGRSAHQFSLGRGLRSERTTLLAIAGLLLAFGIKEYVEAVLR